MRDTTRWPSLGHVLPWLVWPTAALVLITFGLVLSILIWTGQRADADAAAQQKAQLRIASRASPRHGTISQENVTARCSDDLIPRSACAPARRVRPTLPI